MSLVLNFEFMAFQFNDQNFKTEALQGFAIIDFYAEWCGPCKMMAPIFEEVATEYAGKIKMGKMDVDESSEAAGRYGVSGIPTLIFLKDGVEVGRLVGFQSKDGLKVKIEEAFGI